MNSHKHARLTYARRIEMVRQMTMEGLSPTAAAQAQGVTPATARKWLGRFLAGGQAALADASSKPRRSPRSIDPGKALLIVELRRRLMLQAQIGGLDPEAFRRNNIVATDRVLAAAGRGASAAGAPSRGGSASASAPR